MSCVLIQISPLFRPTTASIANPTTFYPTPSLLATPSLFSTTLEEKHGITSASSVFISGLLSVTIDLTAVSSQTPTRTVSRTISYSTQHLSFSLVPVALTNLLPSLNVLLWPPKLTLPMTRPNSRFAWTLFRLSSTPIPRRRAPLLYNPSCR